MEIRKFNAGTAVKTGMSEEIALCLKTVAIMEESPPLKIVQISSLSGGENELFVMGHVNEVPCRMVIDTGAYVTIIRSDLAHKLGGKLIWTPPCVTLQTVTGDKIDVHGNFTLTSHLEMPFIIMWHM